MNAPMMVLALICIAGSVISHKESARIVKEGGKGATGGGGRSKVTDSEKSHILQRLSIGLAGAAAFLLLWSVAPDITAIWLWLGTAWGIGIVVIVAMFTLWGSWHLLIRGVKYRLEATYFVVLLLALDAGILVGGWPAFTAGGGDLLAQAWKQGGHVASGQTSSQAIKAAHHAARATAGGSGWAVTAVIAAALVLFLLWWRAHHRHRSEQRAALTTGQPGLGTR